MSERFSEGEKQKVVNMNLNLYKRFGYPEIKELGLDSADSTPFETVGEIYTINLSEIRNSEGNFILFEREDLEKLLRHDVGAVELRVANGSKLSIINHYFHDGRE